MPQVLALLARIHRDVVARHGQSGERKYRSDSAATEEALVTIRFDLTSFADKIYQWCGRSVAIFGKRHAFYGMVTRDF
jgi:hypothetical protein